MQRLSLWGISMLFVVGGNGATLQGSRPQVKRLRLEHAPVWCLPNLVITSSAVAQ